VYVSRSESGSESGSESEMRGKERDGERGEEEEWEFGGLSVDGDGDGGGMVVCKHLVACLLGERWREVLGGFVTERGVGRGEMAGLAGES
jgi:hypothetical protein